MNQQRTATTLPADLDDLLDATLFAVASGHASSPEAAPPPIAAAPPPGLYRHTLAATARGWAWVVLPPVLALLATLGGWVAWIRVRDVPGYLVPSPGAVFEALRSDPDRFFDGASMSLLHALGGLALGSGVAFLLGIAMAHARALERALYPLAIMVKVTPIVAVAPLLIIWFGFGHAPKFAVAALITFFPMLVNTVTGLRSVDPAAHEVLRALRASRWQVFRMLRLPSAVPYLFAALRISVPLSLIGAVVAEWAAADSGMGQVIVIAHGDFDMASLFAAIVVLAALGTALMALVALTERRFLDWHESRIEG